MEEINARIINLQMMLNAEIAREVEHGATRRDVYTAFAKTLTDKMNAPTSAAWVEKTANSDPRTLTNVSLTRFLATEKILQEHMTIWK